MTSSHTDLLQPGWSSLSGRILDGGFELQEMLEADETQARFKVRVLGDRELDCVALFFQVNGAEGDRQVELWSLAKQLRHPNVSAPLGAGRLQVDGISAIYAVVRRADESLDAVLGERALTVAEAGDALHSVARALEVLHLNDVVYGCLAPSRVLAVSETIQLPAECVRAAEVAPVVRVFAPAYLAPESGSENVSPASDLWCLGATLFEALTQKPWTEERREETGALPEPFASIALRCLHADPQGRASLGEVMALFRGELKPVPRVRAAVAGSATTMIVPEADLSQGAGVPLPTQAAELRPAVLQPAGKQAEMPVPTAAQAQQTPEKPFSDKPVTGKPSSANSVIEKPTVDRQTGPRQPVATALAPTPVSTLEGTQATPPAAFLVRAASEPAAARPRFEEKLFRSPGASRPVVEDVVGNPPVAGSRGRETESGEPATKLWIWAGLTLLVVLGLIWALRPKPAVVQQPGPAATASAAHQEGSAAVPAQPNTSTQPNASAKPNISTKPHSSSSGDKAWQTRTLEPDGSTPRVTPSEASPVPAKSATANSVAPKPAAKPAKASAGVFAGASGEVWRVVAFTYARREDAENRAKVINAKHANFRAGVFSPSGSSTPFLVVLGDWMSREEASQVRRKAVASGLPHDSYIQNFTK